MNNQSPEQESRDDRDERDERDAGKNRKIAARTQSEIMTNISKYRCRYAVTRYEYAAISRMNLIVVPASRRHAVRWSR
jgi:hypothetical protein